MAYGSVKNLLNCGVESTQNGSRTYVFRRTYPDGASVVDIGKVYALYWLPPVVSVVCSMKTLSFLGWSATVFAQYRRYGKWSYLPEIQEVVETWIYFFGLLLQILMIRLKWHISVHSYLCFGFNFLYIFLAFAYLHPYFIRSLIIVWY